MCESFQEVHEVQKGFGRGTTQVVVGVQRCTNDQHYTNAEGLGEGVQVGQTYLNDL